MRQEAVARFKPHVEASRKKGPLRMVGQAPASWKPTMAALSGAERVAWEPPKLIPFGETQPVALNITGTNRVLHAAHGGFKVFLFEVVHSLPSARLVWELAPVLGSGTHTRKHVPARACWYRYLQLTVPLSVSDGIWVLCLCRSYSTASCPGRMGEGGRCVGSGMSSLRTNATPRLGSCVLAPFAKQTNTSVSRSASLLARGGRSTA